MKENIQESEIIQEYDEKEITEVETEIYSDKIPNAQTEESMDIKPDENIENCVSKDTKTEESLKETEEKNVFSESVTENNSFESSGKNSNNKNNEDLLISKLEEILSGQKEINERVSALEKLFADRIMHTDNEEKVGDRMHKELLALREGMYMTLLKPVLSDIIEVRDSIIRMAENIVEKDPEKDTISLETFLDYRQDLGDILEKNGVEIFRSEKGSSLTPLRHKILSKLSTEDSELHNKVCRSLSCGYIYEGRTISPEKLTVYSYENPDKETTQSGGN